LGAYKSCVTFSKAWELYNNVGVMEGREEVKNLPKLRNIINERPLKELKMMNAFRNTVSI
jgi:uncharacterized protein YutE (UPF0331/DUF86 family)